MSAREVALARGEPDPVPLPQVTAAAPLGGDHPDRRFRARAGDGGLWLIRRRPHGGDPDVLLRAFSRTIAPPARDSDDAIAALWFAAAFPDWPAEKAQKAARKALKRRP
jgi:hypothetical protein